MINIKDVQCMCLFEPQCSVIVLAKVPIVSMARYKGALSGKSRYNLWNNVAGPKPHNVVGAVVRRCGFTLKGSLPNLDFISGARGRHSRLGRRSTGIATLQSPLIGESLKLKGFLLFEIISTIKLPKAIHHISMLAEMPQDFRVE